MKRGGMGGGGGAPFMTMGLSPPMSSARQPGWEASGGLTVCRTARAPPKKKHRGRTRGKPEGTGRRVPDIGPPMAVGKSPPAVGGWTRRMRRACWQVAGKAPGRGSPVLGAGQR